MTMNNFFQGPPGPGGERGDTGNPGVVVRFKCKLNMLRIIFLPYMINDCKNMLFNVVCIIDNIKYLEKNLFETWPQNPFRLWQSIKYILCI